MSEIESAEEFAESCYCDAQSNVQSVLALVRRRDDTFAQRIAQLERERDAEHARAEAAYANYVQLMREVADERNATAETVARLERERDRAQAQVAELRRELDEFHATFDLQWAADMRAVARWRAEDPERRALSMPDREAMTFRLLQLLDAAEAQVAELREMLISHARHRGDCAAFPAMSNEQIERDCDCGLSAAIARTSADGMARQECRAQPTGDPPTDCDWPHCGCDPSATKVLQALDDEGVLIDSARQQAVARVVDAAREIDAEFTDAVDGENIVAREDGSVMQGWVELSRSSLQRLSDAMAALDGGVA